MFNKIISLFAVTVFMLSISGCATMQEHKGATTGAAIGAATGATAGALLGHRGAKNETAIIGGLIGALVGGAIGHYAYDVKQSREETVQRYNYQSTSATSVRLENVKVVPATVKAGDTVDVMTTYAVLTPTPETEVMITETSEIRFGEELVGNPEERVMQKGGTYTSTIPVSLPSDAKKGTYKVIATVQSPTSKDTNETTFIVN